MKKIIEKTINFFFIFTPVYLMLISVPLIIGLATISNSFDLPSYFVKIGLFLHIFYILLIYYIWYDMAYGKTAKKIRRNQ